MKEDSFYRYMYIPFYQARVPFRIYSSINSGFAGDFLGIEFSSIALTDRIMNDEKMLEFFRERGLWTIGSRTLLTTFQSYNLLKVNSAKEDNMGEYEDINIFSFPMGGDYFDKLYTNLLAIEAILEEAFGVKILTIIKNDDTTPSVYFDMLEPDINEHTSSQYIKNFKSEDGAVSFYNVLLSTFSTFFDVYVYYKDIEDRLLPELFDISYVAYFKNFVPLEDFKYTFLSELYIRLKVNMKENFVENCKITKLCEFWLNKWESGS
jgi:hypothetical protein